MMTLLQMRTRRLNGDSVDISAIFFLLDCFSHVVFRFLIDKMPSLEGTRYACLFFISIILY